MSYTATYTMNTKNRKIENRKIYKKDGNNFTPSFKEYFYEQNTASLIPDNTVYLLRNIKDVLEKVSDVNEKDNINFLVRKFLENSTSYKVKYSINKSLDSDYYIVEIREKNLTFEEVFNLARNLNRDAVKSGLNFVVIAGV